MDQAVERKLSKKPKVEHPLKQAYAMMFSHYGHLHWWPGETPFEVCVGAILTHNTSWKNVERAIHNLKQAHALDPKSMHEMRAGELARLIHPSGYHNVKARRLKAFLAVLVERFEGSLERFFAGSPAEVRERLLDIHGIGPETADSMMLYAGGHSSFVIDAYTKRIFFRHRWCEQNSDYANLKKLCESALPASAPHELLDYWQDYHAQLVNIGKDFCRKSKPLCEQCPLHPLLPKKGGLPS